MSHQLLPYVKKQNINEEKLKQEVEHYIDCIFIAVYATYVL